MKVYAYWWGVQLVPQDDEDKRALEIIKRAEYAGGYDSPAGSEEAIEEVTDLMERRLKLMSPHGIIISR